MEDRGSRGDRQCVREQACDARRGQRTPALEAELKSGKRRAVERQHRRRECEHGAARDRCLRGDVAAGVQDSGGEPEACSEAENAWLSRHHDHGHGRRGRQPDDHCGRRALRVPRLRPCEREPEEHEAENRKGNSGDFPPGKPRTRPPDQHAEEADPARRHRLHERQGRERKRRDVERPPAEPRRESHQPPSRREQRGERPPRTANAQPRKRRRRVVLNEEAPVQRHRRSEREDEAGNQMRAHCGARFANGRYASAASAATPTRGRSRLRS